MWSKKKIKADIEYHTNSDVIFGVKKYADSLLSIQYAVLILFNKR